MRLRTCKHAALAAAGALGLLAAGAAQADCGSRELGGRNYGSKCQDHRYGTQPDRSSSDYNLGTVRGQRREEGSTFDNGLGSVKRGRRWDRRSGNSLGRGTFKPY